MVEEAVNREAALHLVLRVEPGPRAFQRRPGKVGPQDFRPATLRHASFGQHHGDGVGFLPGGGRGGPDPQPRAVRPLAQQGG